MLDFPKDGGGHESEIEEDEPEISLHALTNINTGKTMQLEVHIGNHKLVALVDFGFTHNFIADEAVQRMGLQLQHRADMSVAVADGDHLTSTGACRDMEVQIAQDLCAMDSYTWTHPLGF